MKRTLHYYIYVSLCLLLAACASESNGSYDLPETEEHKTCRVSVEVSAAGVSQTKVLNDGNAHEGEFIHSLHVFIVDVNTNTVEAEWTLEEGIASGEQENGMVENWQSPDISIGQGRKRVYAFANMENVKLDNDEYPDASFNDLLDRVKVGDALDYFESGKLFDVFLKDSAGSINFDQGYFIPMSCVELHDFDTDITIRLELIRMVSRIDVSVLNNREDEQSITVTGVKFGPYAEKVALISSYVDNTTGESNDYEIVESKGKTPKNPQWTGSKEVNNGSTEPICSFYVNETNLASGNFEIELTTSDGTTLEGTTSKSLLPRNTVYPLRLTFNASLGLDVEWALTPVGGYPRSFTVSPTVEVGKGSGDSNTLSLSLPEGCKFTLTPKLTGMVAKTWKWEAKENVTMFGDGTSEVFEGNMTGVVRATGTIKLTVDEDSSTEKTFTISIVTTAIQDWDEYSASTNALLRWCAAPQWCEPISLTTENEGKER